MSLIFIVIIIVFDSCLIRVFKRYSDFENYLILSLLLVPYIVSLGIVAFTDFDVSFSYLVFITSCHFLFAMLLLNDKYVVRLNSFGSVFNKRSVIPGLLLAALLLLNLFGTYKQLQIASTIIGASPMVVLSEKTQALEELFMQSGYAYLYRLNIPLIIVFEYIRIKNRNNWLIWIECLLLISTLVCFKKTVPIIALGSILILHLILKTTTLRRAFIGLAVIGVFPFVLTAISFNVDSNKEDILKETIEKLYVYVSMQHIASSEIIDKEINIASEDNFQFISQPLNRLSGNKDIPRGEFLSINGMTTNVYSYWGAFYTQFGWFAIPFSAIFLAAIVYIAIFLNSIPIKAYIYSNIMLCFFGNMFEFFLFWVYLIMLIFICKCCFIRPSLKNSTLTIPN